MLLNFTRISIQVHDTKCASCRLFYFHSFVFNNHFAIIMDSIISMTDGNANEKILPSSCIPTSDSTTANPNINTGFNASVITNLDQRAMMIMMDPQFRQRFQLQFQTLQTILEMMSSWQSMMQEMQQSLSIMTSNTPAINDMPGTPTNTSIMNSSTNAPSSSNPTVLQKENESMSLTKNNTSDNLDPKKQSIPEIETHPVVWTESECLVQKSDVGSTKRKRQRSKSLDLDSKCYKRMPLSVSNENSINTKDYTNPSQIPSKLIPNQLAKNQKEDLAAFQKNTCHHSASFVTKPLTAPQTNVFVDSIPENITVLELKKSLAVYGTILNIQLSQRQKATALSAVIQFELPSQAMECVKVKNYINGNCIICSLYPSDLGSCTTDAGVLPQDNASSRVSVTPTILRVTGIVAPLTPRHIKESVELVYKQAKIYLLKNSKSEAIIELNSYEEAAFLMENLDPKSIGPNVNITFDPKPIDAFKKAPSKTINTKNNTETNQHFFGQPFTPAALPCQATLDKNPTKSTHDSRENQKKVSIMLPKSTAMSLPSLPPFVSTQCSRLDLPLKKAAPQPTSFLYGVPNNYASFFPNSHALAQQFIAKPTSMESDYQFSALQTHGIVLRNFLLSVSAKRIQNQIMAAFAILNLKSLKIIMTQITSIDLLVAIGYCDENQAHQLAAVLLKLKSIHPLLSIAVSNRRDVGLVLSKHPFNCIHAERLSLNEFKQFRATVDLTTHLDYHMADIFKRSTLYPILGPICPPLVEFGGFPKNIFISEIMKALWLNDEPYCKGVRSIYEADRQKVVVAFSSQSPSEKAIEVYNNQLLKGMIERCVTRVTAKRIWLRSSLICIYSAGGSIPNEELIRALLPFRYPKRIFIVPEIGNTLFVNYSNIEEAVEVCYYLHGCFLNDYTLPLSVIFFCPSFWFDASNDWFKSIFSNNGLHPHVSSNPPLPLFNAPPPALASRNPNYIDSFKPVAIEGKNSKLSTQHCSSSISATTSKSTVIPNVVDAQLPSSLIVTNTKSLLDLHTEESKDISLNQLTIPKTAAVNSDVQYTSQTFVASKVLIPTGIPSTDISQTFSTPKVSSFTDIPLADISQTFVTPKVSTPTDIPLADISQILVTPKVSTPTDISSIDISQTIVTPKVSTTTDIPLADISQTFVTPKISTPTDIPLADISQTIVTPKISTPTDIPLADISQTFVTPKVSTTTDIPLADISQIIVTPKISTPTDIPLADISQTFVTPKVSTPTDIPLADISQTIVTPKVSTTTDISSIDISQTFVTPKISTPTDIPLADISQTIVTPKISTPTDIPLADISQILVTPKVSTTTDISSTDISQTFSTPKISIPTDIPSINAFLNQKIISDSIIFSPSYLAPSIPYGTISLKSKNASFQVDVLKSKDIENDQVVKLFTSQHIKLSQRFPTNKATISELDRRMNKCLKYAVVYVRVAPNSNATTFQNIVEYFEEKRAGGICTLGDYSANFIPYTKSLALVPSNALRPSGPCFVTVLISLL
ncbi:hypothetical protein RTP6_007630 [Batrachochytrium dendrobatidis]